MDTFTPTAWTGVKPQIEIPTLNVRPNCPFFLMHSAFNWELVNTVDDTWEWLPTFSKLNEMAGVNGVVQTKSGVDSSHSRIKFMEQGYTILDRELEYIARYPTRFGGYFYGLKWNRPKTIGQQTFWKMDNDSYNAWRRMLIEIGYIQLPEDEIIELLLRNVDRRINRRIHNQHVPEVKAQIEELYAVKDRMRKSFDDLKKPRTKRGKK